MHSLSEWLQLSVICRIGSLENVEDRIVHNHVVICRIGSLEKIKVNFGFIAIVICRIGSLETLSFL